MQIARGLKIREIREGNGRKAGIGETVQIRCVCRLNKGDILYSRESEPPCFIRLGTRDAAVAIEQGTLNMKVGGMRTVTSPPQLNHVEQAIFPELSRAAVLHYEIELLDIVD